MSLITNILGTILDSTGIHPKVAASSITATLTTLLIYAVSLTGHKIDPSIAGAIITVVVAVAGYLTPSTIPSHAAPATPATPSA